MWSKPDEIPWEEESLRRDGCVKQVDFKPGAKEKTPR